jgi:hypothetical protein
VLGGVFEMDLEDKRANFATVPWTGQGPEIILRPVRRLKKSAS